MTSDDAAAMAIAIQKRFVVHSRRDHARKSMA